MKAICVALLSLLLSACTLFPTKVVYTPVEVQVPVVTRCVVSYPTKPTPLPAIMPAGMYDRGILILTENLEYRIYSKELEAALSKCADNIK